MLPRMLLQIGDEKRRGNARAVADRRREAAETMRMSLQIGSEKRLAQRACCC
jgi:hypothetical protein